MAGYFFASPIDVDFKLDGEDVRKLVETKGEKDKMISCPVYYDGDTVSGQVRAHFSLLQVTHTHRYLSVHETERRSNTMGSRLNLSEA